MKCPRDNCQNEATNHPKLGVLPCNSCLAGDRKTSLAKPPRFATASQANRVQADQDKNSKDLVQPWDEHNKPNADFAKAYPDKAQDIFSKETMQKL